MAVHQCKHSDDDAECSKSYFQRGRTSTTQDGVILLKQKARTAVALLLQEFVVHSVYRYTEKEADKVFVSPFLTYLLQTHDIVLAV